MGFHAGFILFRPMKKMILLSALILFFSPKAQSFMIQYEERANIENQLKEVTDPQIRKEVSAHLSQPRNFTLYYNNGTSLYIQNNEPIRISGCSLSEIKNTREAFISQNVGGLYKNQATNEYVSEADIFGKKLLVIDQLQKYNWKFSDEGRTIGRYPVKKANAVINGENVTAWFTGEIPVKDGPGDYYGLPGLIVELNTFDKDYVAVDIRKTDAVLNMTKPSKGEPISRENYDEILNETIGQLKKMSAASGN